MAQPNDNSPASGDEPIPESVWSPEESEGGALYSLRELLRLIKEERRLSPEIRAWALQQFTEDELIEGLEQAKKKGGPSLTDVIREIEQELKATV
jgi:hypothetical protein